MLNVMNKEEILEYNKRCAEFIKAKPCKDWQGNDGYEHPDWLHWQWSNRFRDTLELYSYRYSDLKFHSDWNWIMKVVEAIEKLELGDLEGLITDEHGNLDKHLDCEAGIEIDTNSCNIYIQATMRLVDKFIEVSSSTKKEAAIQAINKFLIWYNHGRP